MSSSITQDRYTTEEAAESDRTISPASSRTLCVPRRGTKKRGTFKSFVGWPFVILIIIQVATNLVSHYNQMPPNSPIPHSHNTQTINSRAGETSPPANAARTKEYKFGSRQSTFSRDLSSGMPLQEMKDSRYNLDSSSSPEKKTSSLISLLSPYMPTYITYHMDEAANSIHMLLSHLTSTNIFGPRTLLADAAQISSNPMHQANHVREIIVLNSSNFNAELVQYNHPFPHIKLVEYYLAYCGICLRFKPTYVQLSKEIYPWRNVIRSSGIDLGVSSNTLIASSWSIDVIPTLRIHPPPSPALSAKLNTLAAMNAKISHNDQLKSMSDSYNAANLTIGSLGITKYTLDAKKERLADKVTLLKLDLIRYIERYVSEHPLDLPSTWPDLRSVREESLSDLRRNHPRQELFLIVEAGGKVDSMGSSGADPSSSQPSIGLQIMMELSSSASSKAIRYVRASDNKALIRDVIAHKRRESTEQLTDGQNTSDHNAVPDEQVDLLHKLIENTSVDQQDHVVLIHIDDSRSPYAHSPTNKFPSITVVTSSDLINLEKQYASTDMSYDNNARSKRDAIGHRGYRRVQRSPMNHEDLSKLSSQRRMELITQYINQTYIAIQEDREFLQALSSFDENPTSPNLKREALEKFQATHQEGQIFRSQSIQKSKQEKERKISNSTIKQFLGRFYPTSSGSFLSSASERHQYDHEDDYPDKLKAIRYIFLQEVPRKTLAGKSPVEKLEKLNILINLASVIKAYFPLPDMASVQFIDGILFHLTKQQTLLAAASSDQQVRTSGLSRGQFDFKALKQVIKNLEADGKRLPEIKDWQHCRFSGYPCALWRLFHTLTAFEYKKLSQISQQSQSAPRQVPRQQQTANSTAVQLTHESQASASEQQQQQSQETKPVTAASEENNGLPVERVVSPPSTTTSLSLTIATPITVQDQHASSDNRNGNNNRKQVSEADLPEPVLLVMRDYVTNFFSCEECARNFRQEAMELSSERIRPAEFSILWLWEAHNRVSKRLSISADTNPPEHPKKWYPSFELCPKCYDKPPSYLKDTSVELAAIFHESINWNREETLNFLVREFTRQPMDVTSNLFGYPVPHGFNYVIVIGIGSLLLIILLRCASCYIERQRRHKATLLNGNGAHYSLELQSR